MSEAFRCDVCGDFETGEPTLRLDLELNAGSAPTGMMSLFNMSDASETLDLCSVECCEEVDLDALREDILGQMEEQSQENPLVETVGVDGGEK